MIWTVLLTVSCAWLAIQFRHPMGVAPIIGALVCAACFLRPKRLWVVGLGSILLRDWALGWSLFSWVRLIGMAAAVGVLTAVGVRPSFRSVFTRLLMTSGIFHLSLTVGDWWTGTCGGWPKTLSGLMSALVGTGPYLCRVLAVDIVWAGLFFGLYGVGLRWILKPLWVARS
jgi:hypothetical protein